MDNIVEIGKSRYKAQLNMSNGRLISFASDGTQAVDKSGNFGAVAYTEKDAENLYTHRFTEGSKDKPALVLEDKLLDLSPVNDFSFKGDRAKLEYVFNEDSIDIILTADSNDFSAIGIQLDVNFIDKDQDGDFHTQFLPSYPYSSTDGKIKFYGFNTPDDKWLLILGTTDIDGWRICYIPDMPHVLNGFQMLKCFDRRLKARKKDGMFTESVNISFHSSEYEMLGYAEKYLGVFIPRLKVSAANIGGEIIAEVGGGEVTVTDLLDNNVQFVYNNGEVRFTPKAEGFYKIKSQNGALTADALCFAFSNWKDMFIRATDAVSKPYHCDFNLCEGAMWLNAGLIRHKLFGIDNGLQSKIDEFLEDVLSVTPENVSDKDIGKIVPFEHEYNGIKHSAYHTYKLERIQNQVTQSLCMIELYKINNDERYLELAVNYIENIIRDHMVEGGYLTCDLTSDDDGTDYTTVTCILIGFVDLANLLKVRNDDRYKNIADTAIVLADHLVRRGFNFPSEGTQGRHEMEEGSISCTALSLLYVYLFLKEDKKYLTEAQKFLRLHDAFVSDVPDVRMYRSTLRWWETNWEGDADGSSINAGHAWTIWKAEADFWYAYAVGDVDRALKSYNGYMTSMCKVRTDGRMYTCYTPDYITGKPYVGKTVHSFPENTDSSMPYYMWTRAENTWFGTVLFKDKMCLNASYIAGDTYKINPATVTFDKLFYGGSDKPLEITTDKPITVILCSATARVIEGEVLKFDEIYLRVAPHNNKIIIEQEK